jgi:hypothetical protein
MSGFPVYVEVISDCQLPIAKSENGNWKSAIGDILALWA